MTSPYERANARPSVQTLGEGEFMSAIFSWRDNDRNSLLHRVYCSVNKRSKAELINIMFAREGLTEAGSKREEAQARPTSNRRRTGARKIAKELELQARRGLQF